MRGLATRHVRMFTILALVTAGALLASRPDAHGTITATVAPRTTAPVASAAPPNAIASPPSAPTVAPTVPPPQAPVDAALAVAFRLSVPTPTPTPPTATPQPAIPNGPLLKGRLVTFYGHPQNDRLGILGEFADPRQMIAKLKAQAAAYQAADPSRPAIPTLELIASVASDTPGPDGLYLNRTPLPLIEEYTRIAEQNGCLLLLDIQLGYDTVWNEIARLTPLLNRPHVHLAIDPEFHVRRGAVPGQVFGSVTAAEVTQAGQMLAEIVVRAGITDKVLVIHQFRDDMLPDKAAIKPLPHVQIVTVMDGFGAPGAKEGNYNTFVRDEPIQFGGIKLFYKQDVPLMTPQAVVALDPSPLVVVYQ